MSEEAQLQCQKCGETVPTSQIVTSAQGEICLSCEVDLEAGHGGLLFKLEQALGLPTMALTGLIVVLIPFVFSLTINDLDFVAVGAGAIGGIMAAWGLFSGWSLADQKIKLVAGVAIVELLAIFQITSGLAII